jgi:hypothetical protein
MVVAFSIVLVICLDTSFMNGLMHACQASLDPNYNLFQLTAYDGTYVSSFTCKSPGLKSAVSIFLSDSSTLSQGSALLFI